MKKLFFCLACILFLTVQANAGEKKALLIMLDGLRSDALYSGASPNMDSLMDGTWAEGYRGAFTYQAHTNLDAAPSSATNHVAIATGVTAAKNKVFKNGQINQGLYDEFPTWLQRARKADPDLVSVWLYNWGEDANMKTDATYQNRHGGGIAGDEKLVDETCRILAGTFPDTEGANGTKWTQGKDVDAIMLYLDAIDGLGHRHNFSVNSDKYFESIPYYDSMIGKILETIKNRPNFAKEDWMIVVVSDHGGIYRTHGVVGCENCYTIPMMVSGKNIKPGKMAGQPLNCTCAAYLTQHMTGSIPECFDGFIPETVPEVPASLENPVTDPAQVKTGQDGDFSFVVWFKSNGPQNGDPALVSNKDWRSGRNPGLVLAVFEEKGNAAVTLNLGDGKAREDIRQLFYDHGEWTFFGVTADRDGNAVLYVGTQNGRLQFISDDISTLKTLASSMNWHVGNDGTGAYQYPLNGETRGFQYWPAVLTEDQMNALFTQGLAK
ncbi:MAG: alkaline phosphatase family protein [Thermoguttaceae bacterium]|nr:alkaline phosphatase family protein [Thermoguttaceae bacterium]